MKTADWTKVHRETLQYYLSYVRPGAPLLVKMRALFDTAVSRKRNTPNIVQILCERGADIPLLARSGKGWGRFWTTNSPRCIARHYGKILANSAFPTQSWITGRHRALSQSNGGTTFDLAGVPVVPDIFHALPAKRPHRDAWPLEIVFSIMAKDAPHAIDADCFQALRGCGRDAV